MISFLSILELIKSGGGISKETQIETTLLLEAKVIEVDDFPPEALSPQYKKPAEVHRFFQELGDQRAAS